MADLNSRRLFVLAAGALALAGCNRTPQAPAFKSVDITGADYAQALSLADAEGRPRTLADFRGKVVVVFFGYTQCPDVCPTTLSELAAAQQALGAQGAEVQGVFVTLDPARDTPAVLKAYVGNFGSGIVALHGDETQIAEAAKSFKVYFAKVPGQTDTSYTVDHTAASYVFDRQGRVRLFTRYGIGSEALAHDLKILLDEKTAA